MKGELEWIKVNVNSFDDNKIRLISSMPQGDSVICIWFRLLFEAGKNNDEGYVYINEFIPYTCEMLGKIFNRSVKKVQYALDTLKKFMMIEVDEDNFIKIKNWNKYQSVDKLEAIRESGKERTRRCRAKKKAAMEKAKQQEVQGYNDFKENEIINKYSSQMEYYDSKEREINLNELDYNNYKNDCNENLCDDLYKPNFENNEEYPYNYEELGLEYEDAVSEAAIDCGTINNSNLLRKFEDSECPKELQYKNSNSECNVTCNTKNVTVTDKIKNKKKIETKTIEVEEEKDRELDKEDNTNSDLFSNITQITW